jgi:GMP synthase (glutamine-hydrolysing)
MTRLLVADGNNRDGRDSHVEATGQTSAEGYAEVLRAIDPTVRCIMVAPADADARLPPGIGWADLDGVVMTGSSLKVGEDKPEVTRQIDFMRDALAAGLAVFGSCWGVHVATVACGGDVGPSVAGAEYAFARAIRRTSSGDAHPLLQGRPSRWDAPAIHADIVTRPPPGSTVLAWNDVAPVQAIDIQAGRGRFWGTQYHPELDLDEVAIMLARSAGPILDSGLAPDRASVVAYADRIARLHADPGNTALANDLDLGPDVMDAPLRRQELSNFIRFVRGAAAAKERGPNRQTVRAS